MLTSPSDPPNQSNRERLTLLTIVLLAFVVRVWALGAKGLSYDEAASALMARATPLEIIHFHWHAAFEHPPFWQLLLWAWSLVAGQSEFALRLLPALAGVLHVPLVWALARHLDLSPGPRPLALSSPTLPLLSALLVAVMPVLVLYSQEARMYTLVVACALASMILLLDMASPRRSPSGEGERSIAPVIAFVLVNWLMLGLHYYSVLLLAAQGVWLVWAWLRPPQDTDDEGSARVGWLPFAALVVAGLPLLGWLSLAPGFRATAQVVLAGTGYQPALTTFLGELWRDLTFGAFRWQPDYAWVGWILLPLVALGLVQSLRAAWAGNGGARLLLLTVLLPAMLSALLFRSLAARYILWVAPLLAIWCAAGIAWLWGVRRWLGWLALATALTVSATGLYYYYAHFEKSEYRDMARYLRHVADADDAFVLEAPRQHLLARYYLPVEWSFATAPSIELPGYWPVNALPVVPEDMDDLLQSLLLEHGNLWLVLTGEDEVDKGEFVQKYLTAISYRIGCRAWLDVRLCHFLDPSAVPSDTRRAWDVTFGDELTLTGSSVTQIVGDDGSPLLLVQLDWLATHQPTVDYRVSVRLLDEAGNVVAQQDDYPIGPLLPPTAWRAGDEKPGYVTSPMSEDTARLVVGVYDPNTGAPVGEWIEVDW